MNNNNTGFLVFFGLLIALAVGAFFFVPKLFEPDPQVASQTSPASPPKPGDATPSGTSQPDSAGETALADGKPEAAGSAAESPAAAESWVIPEFDVLRVEPDGSTVIAGRAEPGATIEIMDGETVIASTAVGPNGDFVAILDAPLPAGDYQLTLRIVGEGGAIRQSEEVATISIPKDPSGDLLAMVSKPGKASRIIAQPGAADSAEASSAGSAASSTEGAVAASEGAAPETKPAITAVAPEIAAASKPNATEAATAEASAAATIDTPAAIETPELPAAASELTTVAPEVAAAPEAGGASEIVVAPAAIPAAETAPDPAQAEPEVAVAAVAPEAASEAATSGSAGETAASEPPAIPVDATVRVDAVEIEGDKIFVAGSATPGSRVRVSADGVVIGSATADQTGRFIVEATGELAVGDHTISADLMDRTGQTVMLRAAVPFNRPEGVAMAAVAPAESSPAAVAPPEITTETKAARAETQTAAEPSPADAAPGGTASGAMAQPDIASLSQMREDAFEALSTLEDLVSGPEAPNAAAVSAARDTAVVKLKAAATAGLPADGSTEAVAMAQSTRNQAQAALNVIEPPAPPQAAAEGAQAPAPADGFVTGDVVRMREMLTQAQTALAQPSGSAVAAADAAPSTPTATVGQSSEPRTIVQAPLASAPGAVIIRRGDTLWQISRRTYGQGVRYTTIYLANRSQILNPDRIQPGQVFSVPETPLENAEELHRQRLKSGNSP